MGKITDFSFTKVAKLLRDIPKEDWLEYYFTDRKSKCCVIGHYTRLTSANPADFSTNNCVDFNHELRTASALIIEHLYLGVYLHGSSIAAINNTDSEKYPQDSAKRRVFAFLRDAARVNGEKWHKSLNPTN